MEKDLKDVYLSHANLTDNTVDDVLFYEPDKYKVGLMEMDYNHMTEIPIGLTKYKNLDWLTIRYNRIRKIPLYISQIPLTVLNLTGNQLTEIPPFIDQLRFLKELVLNDNKISEIPINLKRCHWLEILSLQKNQIRQFPLFLRYMFDLKSLDFRENLLTSIPEEVNTMTNLDYLDIRGNPLNQLPQFIRDLEDGGYVDLFYMRKLFVFRYDPALEDVVQRLKRASPEVKARLLEALE